MPPTRCVATLKLLGTLLKRKTEANAFRQKKRKGNFVQTIKVLLWASGSTA